VQTTMQGLLPVVYLRYKRYVNTCVWLNELDKNLRPYVPEQICNIRHRWADLVSHSNYKQYLPIAAQTIHHLPYTKWIIGLRSMGQSRENRRQVLIS